MARAGDTAHNGDTGQAAGRNGGRAVTIRGDSHRWPPVGAAAVAPVRPLAAESTAGQPVLRESVQEHWFRRGAEAGLGVGETSGAGSTTRRNCGSEWHDSLGMHAFIGVCSWSCGANLHEIVERFVEGEGGGGGRGCANGRFALPVAGQACSCRHARHGRLVFVGALVAFLAKKRVKNRRGSTNGQNSPFLGLRKSNSPKTVLASGAGNQKKTQTGWLSAFFALGR